MHGGGTLGALSSHGLIEVHCYSRVEKLFKSHKALEMVPLEQCKWILKLRLLSHGLNVEVKLRMKWSSSTIWVALNGRSGNHRPLDDDFQSNVGWTLRIRLCMPKRLSKAWGLDSLWWNATYWWLRGWRSWWSLCRVSELRRARGHPALRKRNGRGLSGLKWILRSGGSWPGLARYWRVGMASSNARHGRNEAIGVGRPFKRVATGHGMKRKLIGNVALSFARSRWAC